jgi:hypothetical protein
MIDDLESELRVTIGKAQSEQIFSGLPRQRTFVSTFGTSVQGQ